MGNAQTTAGEATFFFFVIFSLAYALGILIAYRVFILVHGRWFPCSRSNRSEPFPGKRQKKKQHHESWYERLRKPPYFPATLAYIITWAIVFFLQAYTLWRIVINVPAFHVISSFFLFVVASFSVGQLWLRVCLPDYHLLDLKRHCL